MDKSVGEIAELVGGVVVGDAAARISGVNGIQQARSGDLTFVRSAGYLEHLSTTHATAALVTDRVSEAPITLIQVKDPYRAFVQVLQHCSSEYAPPRPQGIHPTAVIGERVQLGDDVAIDAHVRIADECIIGSGTTIYAGSYVGRGSRIGSGSTLHANVTLRESVVVGARCVLHAGVVIGSDGFGFAPVQGRWFKIPQVGNVVIGDDVEIGTNTAVDRATFGSTVIGSGTKIDNLVQIGHNVRIGENCVISGMTGIAGSTTIGNNVTIAAQVGIADHIEIGDGATIAGRAGVATNVKPGQVVSGFPAMEHNAALRIMASTRRLPDMAGRVKQLELRIQELEKILHGETEDHS